MACLESAHNDRNVMLCAWVHREWVIIGSLPHQTLSPKDLPGPGTHAQLVLCQSQSLVPSDKEPKRKCTKLT